MSKESRKALNQIARAQKKRSLARFYNVNSMCGNDWAIFRIIIGARMTGKSYSVTERMCNLKKKLGDGCKCYWLRISETSTKQLLSNKAAKLVDPDLQRKYQLELTTKGNVVFNHGKTFAEVYPLSSFAKMKGVAFFDCEFQGKYFIVLDEFQLEIGERRTSFEILYNFIGFLENIARTTKNNIEVWLLGNNLQEASEILKAFSFIPETYGRYYLKRKRCIIDYIEPSDDYLKDRKGSIADILGGSEMSNFTNEIEKDFRLISKEKLIKPQAIIKFGKNKDSWYTLWNSNLIKRYNGQNCPNVIAMRPYISQLFSMERRQNIIDLYDMEAFKYATLVDKTYFESDLKKIRTTK